MYSGRSRLEGELHRFKAQIAGNSYSIAKICNDEAVQFSSKMHVHEQIRGSQSRLVVGSVSSRCAREWPCWRKLAFDCEIQ